MTDERMTDEEIHVFFGTPRPDDLMEAPDPDFYEEAEDEEEREQREKAEKLSIVQGIERRCDAYVVTNIDTSRPVQQVDVARLFVEKFESDVRFMSPGSQWYYWTGTRWHRDANLTVKDLMVRHVKRVSDMLQAFGNNRANIANNGFINGALALVESDERIKIAPISLDADSFMLGTPTGNVNLQTGTWLACDKDALITMATSVDPAGEEKCPKWKAFLAQVTGGESEFARYLKLWAGYCLTGDISEEQLLFIHARGGRGKGTFLKTIEDILGDYATSIQMDILLAKPGQAGHPTDIASLRGARAVFASETEPDSIWNAARIKAMSGGDSIRAHFMHKDSFVFTPKFKLIGQGEHLPRLKHVGDGERRRFRIAPFLHNPTVKDTHLKAALRAEAPGILRWMINGAVEWHKRSFKPGGGLAKPRVVDIATANYFVDQNLVARWMRDCCERGETLEAPGTEVNASWLAWLKANEIKHRNLPVHELVEMEGISKKRIREGEITGTFYRGFRVV
jgi:putative DNA primase/helicase